MTTEPSAEQIAEAVELLKPKGSQPADDAPVAVITVFRSSFVQIISHPTEAPLNDPTARHWLSQRAAFAADAIAGVDDDIDTQMVLTAPEVLAPLDEAQAPEPHPEPKTDRTHFEVYKGKDGWRWRLRAGNGEPIASGEAYKAKRDCMKAVKLVAAVIPGCKIEML